MEPKMYYYCKLIYHTAAKCFTPADHPIPEGVLEAHVASKRNAEK